MGSFTNINTPPEAQAQIFLSDQRKQVQNHYAQHYDTVVTVQDAEVVEGLRTFSDDRLKPGISLLVQAEENGLIVLIPWIGDVVLMAHSGEPVLLQEGQVHAICVKKGEYYELRNPYEDEGINFFQLRFAGDFSETGKIFPIALENHPNALAPLYEGHIRLFIGQFKGRAEGSYSPKSSDHMIFAFAIEGAFELQNRLIETRDGLALWNTQAVAFEALSQGAVLLIVEI